MLIFILVMPKTNVGELGGIGPNGLAFTEFYYSTENGGYFDDYHRVLAQALPSVYHVENSWENYDKIASVIAAVFNNWKMTHSK